MAQTIHRVAWAVTKGSDEKDHWTRIGRSFLNKGAPVRAGAA